VPRGDSAALGTALSDLLADPDRRAGLAARGAEVARRYDWPVLARRILAVYETVATPGGGGVTALEDDDVPGVPPTGVASRSSRWRGSAR
jgi:phosphatidylinositol alpha-mannosyltransferase